MEGEVDVEQPNLTLVGSAFSSVCLADRESSDFFCLVVCESFAPPGARGTCANGECSSVISRWTVFANEEFSVVLSLGILITVMRLVGRRFS